MTEVTLLLDWRANCSEPFMEYVKCFLTTTAGSASAFCNGMIVFTITNQKIRCSKELLIVVALAFTDFVEAFATFIGGVHCFVGHAFFELQLSSIQCMMLPQYWMWRWSDFATAFMMFSVNADRLFFLVTPITYTALTVKY
uniref:G-protein coupled receptors family 1 profile domain-containing protein n=1 Tax=Parascaris univalens TaxID=6257 RepID=A0A914ZKC1_PARUN